MASISPTPTVPMATRIKSSEPYAYRSTHGMMTVLARMGGTHTNHLCFLTYHEPAAPISVARLPNTTSRGMAPQSRLESRHPTNSPGTAAGVKKGRMQRASAILN